MVDQAELRMLVLRVFARDGRPPTFDECAELLDAGRDEVREAARALADRRLLVLDGMGERVRMAHPFSAQEMGFLVTAGERWWWGGCGWDSFGIAAALGEDIDVLTSCPGCSGPVRVAVRGGRATGDSAVARFPVPARHWWDDVVATCSRIRLFHDPSHAAYHAGEHREPVGELVGRDQLWELSALWYGDRLYPDFHGRRPEDAQRILTRVGLTGPAWQLA